MSKNQGSSPPPVNGTFKTQMQMRFSREERSGLEAMKADTGCSYHEFIRRAMVASLTKRGYLKVEFDVEKATGSAAERRRKELKL